MVKKIQLSDEGLQLSNLALGLWRLPNYTAPEVVGLLNHAIDLNITTIDQADIYGNYNSQSYLGKALKVDKSLRKKLQIVSKTGIVLPNSEFSQTGIGFYDTSFKHIMESVEQTLIDLGTDYLDLLLIHRPDILMQPDELDKVFNALLEQGKVLNFGVSNFTNSQFEMLQSKIEIPLVTNQIEFSVLHLNPLFDGTFDGCIKNRINPMIWSPLAGGKLFKVDNPQTTVLVNILQEIGNELGGASVEQVALAWIKKHPSNPITVVGTLKQERITSAAMAMELDLSTEQWYRILIAAQGHPVP